MKKIKSEKTKYFRFTFEFSFDITTLDYCRYLKKEYGFSEFNFVPETKSWGFNNPQIGEDIAKRYPDVEIDESTLSNFKKVELERETDTMLQKNSERIKRQHASGIEIKGLKQELYPYQKVGVEFFANNKGRAILADVMGIGKSAQALAYAVYEKLDRILVICPASVKSSWEIEVKKWTKLNAVIINSKSDLTELLESKGNVFIINYDILGKFLTKLRISRWDLLICDEFHYIKNHKAKRTQNVRKISKAIPRLLLLSGTPLLSRPIEMFNGLNMLQPSEWKNWFTFTKRYCAGHYGRFGYDATGASHLGELRDKIKHSFLRRTKEEVLPDLPKKRRIDLPVDLDPETKRNYDLAEAEFLRYLIEVKKKKEEDARRSVSAENLVKLGELRQLTTRGKMDYAEEVIKHIIDGGEKVVVFSVYNEPLDRLKEKFGNNALLLTGKTPEDERADNIKKFQSANGPSIFLGGLKSAGVGITLTEASNVLFLDFSWTPADMEQAEDRCFAIGTPVYTPSGIVPIEKIKLGDLVFSHTGTIRKVKDVWKVNSRKKIMVELDISGHGKIRVTNDHLFMREDRSWVEAGLLLPGEKLAMPGNITKNELKRIDIPKNMWVAKTFINNYGKRQKNGMARHIHTLETTDDFLFSVGYYIGDGFSSIRRNKGCFVSFAGNDTSKIIPLDRVNKWMRSININNYNEKREDGHGIERRYYSKELATWFLESFGHMARNKKIPEWGLQMNKRQSHILLDGLIASDGYIRSNRVEYSTMSDILSSHVYILATRCGYRPSIIQVKTGIYIIGWSITPNNIHTGSVKSIFISKPTRVAINRGIRKDEPLYDISIEKDETLVVGGVVAHNCHRIGQEADSVTIYQLFAKGTIDQYMSELLGEKQKIFDKVMNGEVIDSPRETSLVGDLLKNIQK